MRAMLLTLLVLGISAATASAQAEKSQPTARVAVVNVGQVIKNYTKAQKFSKDVEEALAPFKKQAQRYEDDIASWQKAIVERDFTKGTEAELQTKIAASKNHLEKLNADVTDQLAKIKDDNLVTLWKEIHAAIKTCATENKIDVVLGYGDVSGKHENLLDLFPNVNRKMQAMDLGGTVPLYRSPRADISQAVIDTLNKQPREKAAKTPPAGTERVAVVNVGYVFNNYSKATKFKALLEMDLVPFKRKARKLTDDIRDWEDALRSRDFADLTEDELKANIGRSKKELEDLNVELTRLLGKKQEDRLVELWKGVQGAIKSYATRRDIDLVLGYGDPIEMELLDLFPNVNRKMQAMDFGSTMPLVADPGRIIDVGVVRLLNSPDEENKDEKVEISPPVRVGVVNIGYVFNKYDRAQRIKKELELALQPYKEKTAKIRKDQSAWEAKLTNGGLNPTMEEEYKQKITAAKAELEDMMLEISRVLGKKQEDNLVTLWKEVQVGNKAVAGHYEFDIVLGYGDPIEKELLDQFPNVKRKMEAMDLGSIVPLYVAPGVALGESVTGTLNRWCRETDMTAPPKVSPPDKR